MRPTVLLLAGMTALGCARATADPPGPAPSPPEARAPSTGRARLRYAFARHFARAETRRDQALFVDLGSPAGAKHTWGGWRSGVGPDVTADGASASPATGSRSQLILPLSGGERALTLRVRGTGNLRIAVDDRELGSEALGGGWQSIEVALPELARGDHEITLAGARGLLVDWMAAGRERFEDAGARPSAEGDRLTIPSGWSVGYAARVPAGARLRARVQGEATLVVRAVRESGEALELGRARGSDAGQAVDLDLSALSGEVVRLELDAEAGTLELLRPGLVTLDGASPAALARPRNVVVYLVDTLRADRLQAYAPQTRVQAPAMARFARDATVFESARAQECWTKPSVATLLSSLMPWEHAAFADGTAVPSSVRLAPELLQARGFHTAAFVANGYVSERFGFQRGWDRWRNYIREGRRSQGEIVAQDVLEWLDGRPQSQPFFLYVHAIDPHVPYRPPEDILRLYDPEPYRGPVDFRRDALVLERIKTGALRIGERDRRRLEALYDGEVSYHDRAFAAILEGLARRGLDRDTMVVVTADHGEELFDHGSVGHGHSLHEELVHVPLIVRAPGNAPSRIDSSVGLVDVLPTILDALGEPIPSELSGRSLWPLLHGEGEGAPGVAVSGFMEHWRAVASSDLKLIARPGNRVALYDLRSDPTEQRDLAGQRPIAQSYLRGLLGLRLAEASAPRGTAPPARHRAPAAVVDPELAAQLRALGYVGH